MKHKSVHVAVNILPNLKMICAKYVGMRCMASKMSKACDISPKVRKEVLERDNHQCIICGTNQNLQIAHYVSRARLGLGIPQNLAVMCASCHYQMDNGKFHRELQKPLESIYKHIMTIGMKKI
jgi:5-methylcytosine-specific restriction endonuclease McrA